MKNLTKTLLATATFLGASLFVTNAFADTQLGVSAMAFDADESYNLAEGDDYKIIPGLSLGFEEDGRTLRFTYNQGDIWTNGYGNMEVRSLRMDYEMDWSDTMLRPYTVLGVGHFNTELNNDHTSSTVGTAGFGLKLNLSKNLMTSLDYRVAVRDKGGLDQDVAMFQLTYSFGNDEPEVFVPKYQPPVVIEKEEPKALPEYERTVTKLLFKHDSAVLSDTHKQALRELVLDNKVMDIVIEGHASHPGTDRYNMNLSEQRVQNVINYIHTVDPTAQMTATAFGETYATEDEEQSRNVMVTVTKMK